MSVIYNLAVDAFKDTMEDHVKSLDKVKVNSHRCSALGHTATYVITEIDKTGPVLAFSMSFVLKISASLSSKPSFFHVFLLLLYV